MRLFRSATYLTAVFASAIFFGCDGGTINDNAANASNSQSNANLSRPNTNAEELGLLINFSWETEDLAWKKDDAKKTLVAAFRLSPENAKKLSEQLTAKGQGAPKELAVEDWFPSELVAQGETSGGSTVPATAFPADDVYQQPYTQGIVSRVDGTDYFVIELNAK